MWANIERVLSEKLENRATHRTEHDVSLFPYLLPAFSACIPACLMPPDGLLAAPSPRFVGTCVPLAGLMFASVTRLPCSFTHLPPLMAF